MSSGRPSSTRRSFTLPAPELTLRTPTPGDAEGIAYLANAHSQALDGTADETAAGVREWFDLPRLEMLVAETREGELAAYGDLHATSDERTRWWLDVREHPERRGSAVAIVAQLEERARERSRPGALLRAVVHSEEQHLRRLFEQRGYAPIRFSFRMGRPLEGDLPAPVWPEGIVVGPAAVGDERRVYEAHMDSFADHWDFEPDPFDEWQKWHLQPEQYDPKLWFLAQDGGELAGICLCRPQHAGESRHGWIGILGVRPAWRRRGLGVALLHHAFRELHARGKTRVGLGVDGENTTGAVALYERVGMTVTRRNDTYELVLGEQAR